MSLLALGLDHRSTPLVERERLTYADAELLDALPRLQAAAQLEECFLLSTCNRTEIYAVRGTLSGTFEQLQSFLARDRAVDGGLVARRAHNLHDDAAVSHLFRVASGLESMVLGESQVLGQLRSALAAARRAGTLGPELDGLGRYAVACARRARSETGIGRSPMSFAQAAVTLARQEWTSLEQTRVVVLGAGAIAASLAAWFKRAGAARITVVSRTFEKAEALAARYQLEVRPLAELSAAIVEADVLVAAVDASEPVVGTDLLQRKARLLAIDLGVPRSLSPALADWPGVRLHDLDSLEQVVAAGRRLRSAEVTSVEAIVAEESERYLTWQRARHVAPTIAQLQIKGETIRAGELERFARELRDLSPEQRQAVESLSRSLVHKLLMNPVLRLKDQARAPHGLAYLDVVRSIFGLTAEGEVEARDADDGLERKTAR